jgi:hypothetical protein
MRIISALIGASLLWLGTYPTVLSLDLSPLTPSTKVGQAVMVRATVTNTSDGDVTYSNKSRDCDYSFKVTAPSGDPATETAQMKSLKCDGGGLVISARNIVVTLKPGESDSEDIRLTDLFQFSQTGKYTVEVTRVFPKLGRCRSNTAIVTVSN